MNKKETALNKEILYFDLHKNNTSFARAGGIIPNTDSIMNSSEFKGCVLSYIEYFNEYLSTYKDIPSDRFWDIGSVSPAELGEFNFLRISKHGPGGFIVQLPAQVLLSESCIDVPAEEKIRITLVIGSPEFYDRIADKSDADKQRSIDRLLTRAFQQRIENHNIKPEVFNTKFENKSATLNLENKETWFLLYDGIDQYVVSQGRYVGRTIKKEEARKHWEKSKDNPYNIHKVVYIMDDKCGTICEDSDWDTF